MTGHLWRQRRNISSPCMWLLFYKPLKWYISGPLIEISVCITLSQYKVWVDFILGYIQEVGWLDLEETNINVHVQQANSAKFPDLSNWL